jgi:hypothetical protein
MIIAPDVISIHGPLLAAELGEELRRKLLEKAAWASRPTGGRKLLFR